MPILENIKEFIERGTGLAVLADRRRRNLGAPENRAQCCSPTTALYRTIRDGR